MAVAQKTHTYAQKT